MDTSYNPTSQIRDVGHPDFPHRTLRKGREGWGTLGLVMPRVRNSLALDVGVFLIALQDVGLGDYAF